MSDARVTELVTDVAAAVQVLTDNKIQQRSNYQAAWRPVRARAACCANCQYLAYTPARWSPVCGLSYAQSLLGGDVSWLAPPRGYRQFRELSQIPADELARVWMVLEQFQHVCNEYTRRDT